MAKTMREQFAKALKECGEREVSSRSGKYLTFTRKEEEGTFYFIGKSGSLRYGKNATSSIPVSNRFKNELLGINNERITPKLMNGVSS